MDEVGEVDSPNGEDGITGEADVENLVEVHGPRVCGLIVPQRYVCFRGKWRGTRVYITEVTASARIRNTGRSPSQFIYLYSSRFLPGVFESVAPAAIY